MTSYTYNTHIASKICNYKNVWQDLNIDDFKSKPPDCTRASFPFKNNPSDHVITGDHNIINNTSTSYEMCSSKDRNIVSLNP